MKWRTVYDTKIKDATEAVRVIESGQRVVIGHACGEPQALVEAMVKRKDELQAVEIVHMVAMGKAEYCLPEMEGHFRHNALFVGGSTRKAINEGRADFTPVFFSEIPSLFRDGYLPPDVALVQVSPPDQNGFCSLGVSVDYTLQALRSARTVIAQVNQFMPRTLGDSFVHVSELDIIVPFDEPLIELGKPKISEVEENIGRHVAELVPDGATLQLGIGAIPDAVLRFLTNKNDLGIHSEMFSDGVVDLYEAGVINNKAKTLHPGKMLVTFLMGTRALYDFVHDNPVVEMHSVDYTNNPYIIGQNERLTAINSALQVDLCGQVCADSIGYRQFSAVGGQVDFVRGARLSRGGKSIIALPSTAAGGKISRIALHLDEGAGVTTSRNDVDYVVTEYGIAGLKGKTVRQRANALIEIAHPQFREELRSQAKKQGIPL